MHIREQRDSDKMCRTHAMYDIQLAALLLHMHQQNVFFHCVHIVRIVFVLTTLDLLLQTQDEWKAICFEETSDCYVDLDEKTT